jgi:hypothetical protein
MGRGSGHTDAAQGTAPERGNETDSLFGLRPPTGQDTASDAQRYRLQEEMNVYANAALARNIALRLGAPEGPAQSYTDMNGNVTVYTGWPPDDVEEERRREILRRLGMAEDSWDENLPALRELTAQGLLRHEVNGHEKRTDPEVFCQFRRDGKKLDPIVAGQIHGIWNTLEDGMIEERIRTEEPGAYRYISALNAIYPRVGQTTAATEDERWPFQGDWKPADANGKPLKLGPNGEVIVPKGTRTSPWGAKPISLRDQMRAALLAEAVPEFAPGELHPEVQAALDEVRPFIDASVRGNSADCVANAYKIHALLLKRNLLPDADEIRSEMEKAHKELDDALKEALRNGTISPDDLLNPPDSPGDGRRGIQIPMSAPQPPADDSQQGQGQGQQNPTPDVPGQVHKPSKELQEMLDKAVAGAREKQQAQQDGDGGEDQQDAGDPSAGQDDKPWARKDQQPRQGDKSGDAAQSGESAGDGQSNESGAGQPGNAGESDQAQGGDETDDSATAGKAGQGDDTGEGAGAGQEGQGDESQASKSGQAGQGGDSDTGSEAGDDMDGGAGAGQRGESGGSGKNDGAGKSGESGESGQASQGSQTGQDSPGGQGTAGDGNQATDSVGKQFRGGSGQRTAQPDLADSESEDSGGDPEAGDSSGDSEHSDSAKSNSPDSPKQGKPGKSRDPGRGANEQAEVAEPDEWTQQPGGDERGPDYRPGTAPLPVGQREKNQKNHEGSVTQRDIDKLVSTAKNNVRSDRARQQNAETRDLRAGRVSSNHLDLPTGHTVESQADLRQTRDGWQGKQALEEEAGAINRTGQELAAQMRQMKVSARGPKRYRRHGKLDTSGSGLARAVAGSKRVMIEPGKKLDMNFTIAVSIDRSLSTAQQTAAQYRMAQMFAISGKETQTPTSIMGWRGSRGETQHAEYKAAHSDDLSSLDAMFEDCGGGTPMAEGMKMSLSLLARAKTTHKILPLITDGQPNHGSHPGEIVQAAQKMGVTVLGLGFADGCDADMMADCFGQNFAIIQKYEDAPRIVADLMRRMIASGH